MLYYREITSLIEKFCNYCARETIDYFNMNVEILKRYVDLEHKQHVKIDLI